MPQPFKSLPVAKRGNVSLGSAPQSPSDFRPELALLAMTVIASWSTLENFVRSLFLAVTGGQSTPEEAAAFAGIQSQTRQTKALRAAADKHIQDQETRDLVYAVLDVYGQASKTRNRVAHWIWGYSTGVPDGVLLANPVTSLEQKAEGHNAILEMRGVWIYKASDFQEAIDRIDKAIDLVARIRFFVAIPPENRGLITRLLGPLQNEPRLRRSLNHLNKARQNAPKGCLPLPHIFGRTEVQ